MAQKLVLAQRGFYAEVARRFGTAGDRVQLQGERLTGSRLLWQSFVTTRLPISVEANEILRSLLFGGEAILAGAERAGSQLDNVRDIYVLFSSRPEDPLPTNILVEIEAPASDLLQRLWQIVAEIINAIENSGEPEPPELFAATEPAPRLIVSARRPGSRDWRGSPWRTRRPG